MKYDMKYVLRMHIWDSYMKYLPLCDPHPFGRPLASSSGIHSGQTTGHSREHARDLSTSGQFPSSSHKIPRSTSATRAISVLSSIILPLQTFFSRVLLLRQQPFSSKNLPPERPTTTIAIKTQVFMFRYESVNSTRKFTIVAEIVSLLKKIYKRDAPFRAVFKVKTLAVLFSAYPREMKHIPRKSAAILSLLVSMEIMQSFPTRARGLSMRTHLTAVDLWPGPTPEVSISRTSRHCAHAQSRVRQM